MTGAATLLLGAALTGAAPDAETTRLLTLGAAVTETVAALGFEEAIVGVDTTSRFPETLSDRPRVGYLRTLSAEGLISLRPTRVIGSEAAGPAAAIEALRSAGLDVQLVPEARDWPEAKARMLAIGRALDREAEAKKMVGAVDQRLSDLAQRLDGRTRPKVLFLFAHGRAPVVAGKGTTADTMIALAGAVNALPGITGYEPPSAEAVVAAEPDVILTAPSVLERMGGTDGVLELPGLRATPAAQAGRIVVMDAVLLLGMGPRTATAAERLASKLHPTLASR